MNYYEEIKRELIENEVNKKVKDYSKNKYELQKYYNVGRLLSDAGNEYGESIIKKYSIKLINELNKKYDVSSLNKMRKFYRLIEKMATVSPNLSYSHYVELLPYDSDLNKIKYYIKMIEERNLGIRKLREIIKNKEYERLPEDTKNKLTVPEESSVIDYVKNPIIIKNKNNYEILSEKFLHQLILEDIESFMKELGNGFCFIGSEYKIKVGDTYYYIDLLLFNYIYNCFVVVELKITEIKKEHYGQIKFYMNYIDDNLKNINQNKTVGIIICKQGNDYIVKYCSLDRIIEREYVVM